MKEKCNKCNSENVRINWTKAGMFISYYDVVCEDCGHVQHKRG